MSMFRTRGFGLIEILVAIFVVAFGVLAVGKLQTNLITSSAENKARFEALSLAQGKLEDIKSYFQEEVATGELISQSNFITYIDAYPSNNAAETVVGTFATFTVTPSFTTTTDSDIAIALVSVSWKDSKGQAQDVSVNSALTFHDLGSVGAGAIAEDTNYIEAPTGRAHLGDGTLSADDKNLKFNDNDDGTSIYGDASQDGSEVLDLLLAIGDQVVLTLEDACVITEDTSDLNTQFENYDCTDFVRISGRVYFNENYKVGNGSGLGIEDINPSEYFVLASDAAYCARYFNLGGEEGYYTFESSDNASLRIDDLPYEGYTTARVSDGKQYYYDYTCYIGGGWHGNIGLVATSDAIKDAGLHACVGDPNDAALDTVEFALRRSYRGMVWRDDTVEAGFAPETVDGRIVYYSWGVADASEIGGNDVYNHDFLVVTDGDDCFDEDVFDKSTFASNVDDFFCLNEITNLASGLIPPSNGDLTETYTTNVDVSGKGRRTNLDERNLDKDRDGVYENSDGIGYYDYCPYDPTNPPYFFHTGSGVISIKLLAGTYDASDLTSNVFLKTSQGDNCDLGDGFTLSSGDVYTSDYTCTLYDSGKTQGSKLVAAGVTGVLGIFNKDTTEITLNCTNEYFTFTDSTGWDAGDGFSFDCEATETGAVDTNLVPQANNDAFTVTKGSELVININSQLLGNDLPGDGLTTFVSVNLTASGHLQANGDGTLSYTYDEKFAGKEITDTYTYTIQDEDGDTSSAEIVITVTKN